MKRLAALAALLLPLAALASGVRYLGFAGGAFLEYQQTGGPIPSVIGQASSAAAGTVLTNAGFTLGTVTTKCSTATVNSVIDQDPAAGSDADAGTAVNVQTSTAVACVNHGGGGVRLKGFRMRGI